MSQGVNSDGNKDLQIVLLIHAPFSCSCGLCRRIATVVKRSKYLVPRHLSRAIIALKIAVMQLMKKVSCRNALSLGCLDCFKPGMRKCRVQTLQIEVKKNVNRMGGDDKMNNKRRKI